MVSGECRGTDPSLRLGLESSLGSGLSLGVWKGRMGGFWGMSHPSLPLVRVRVKFGVRLIFRFMGGEDGWFLGNVVAPIPPLG